MGDNMRNIFIVNPCAGQGKNNDKLINFINESCSFIGADYEIYVTKSVNDATFYVKQYLNSYGTARFIACGGDGTLSEVLNGIAGFPDAQVGVMPCGTGNDFCRNFVTTASYRDVISQIYGYLVKCDAIKYTSEINGDFHTGYCANMVNIGFDSNVADMTAEMKKKPLISGSVAYYLSILAKLVKKDGADLIIDADGEVVHSGPLLLSSVANGSYCGGGIKSNPMADVTDGFLNINIVNNVSRLKFIKLLPHYIKGDFIKLKNIESVVKTFKCKKLTVSPSGGTMRMCCDGEIYDAGKTVFEVVPGFFNFIIPSEAEFKSKGIICK